MTNLQSTIEHLYSTFCHYTTAGMHHCDCGCIDEKDVVLLSSRPLRQLKDTDLAPYHVSALYTWGDIEHYKHYLPRAFELYSGKKYFSLISLDEIANKLEYAKWQEWPAEEVNAIKAFITADWHDYVNNSDADMHDNDIANYARFVEPEILLPLWRITESEAALRNFVEFFYQYGNQVLNDKMHRHNKHLQLALRSLIYTKGLIGKLDETFFRHATRLQMKRMPAMYLLFCR